MRLTTEHRPASPPPGLTPPHPPPPPDRSLAAMTVGLAFVAIGTVALLATLGVHLPVTVLAPALLVLLGLGVVASAVRGEASGGVLGLVVFVGVVLALGSVMGAVLDVPVRGGVGERHHRPVAAAELQDAYRLLAGSLVVDLRDVELGPGTTEVEVSTVLGEAVVRLPDDVAVAVDGEVGGGTATVLGVTRDGLSVDNDQQSEDYATAEQRLRLRVRAGLGEVRVTR